MSQSVKRRFAREFPRKVTRCPMQHMALSKDLLITIEDKFMTCMSLYEKGRIREAASTLLEGMEPHDSCKCSDWC